MRLIDEDTLCAGLVSNHHVVIYAKSEPTVDAVPVVRCKDCKYWHKEIHNGTEYFNFSSCDLNHGGDGNNFYCADAERRTDDSI